MAKQKNLKESCVRKAEQLAEIFIKRPDLVEQEICEAGMKIVQVMESNHHAGQFKGFSALRKNMILEAIEDLIELRVEATRWPKILVYSGKNFKIMPPGSRQQPKPEEIALKISLSENHTTSGKSLLNEKELDSSIYYLTRLLAVS